MIYKTLFIAFICLAAMTVLVASRVFRKADNPKLDMILARIVFIALGALLLVWQMNG